MISKGDAEHDNEGDDSDDRHRVKRPAMGIIDEKMPAGSAEKRHYHAISRPFLFALNVTLTLALNGEIHLLPQHGGIDIPPGAKHQASNDADIHIECIVISHPATHSDLIIPC